MARGWQGLVLKALGAADHLVTVTGVSDIRPRYRRISFHGPSLLQAAPDHPTVWARFWFTDTNQPHREVQRAYTLLHPHVEDASFDVDFVLHSPAGPASEWARNAAVGQELTAQILGSHPFVHDTTSAGVLLVADPSSTPAVNTIVDSLPPDTRIAVLWEHKHPDDVTIPVHKHPGMTVTRIDGNDPTAISEALGAQPWDDWQAWVAGESSTVRTVRKLVKSRRGATKTNTYLQAYWVKGHQMGVSREVAAEDSPTSP